MGATEAEVILLLKQAYAVFVDGDQAGYDGRMARARTMLDGMEGDPARRMLGEWLLVSRLPHIGDIEETFHICSRAAPLLNGRSCVVDRNQPFNLGSDSILMWLWRKPGELDAISRRLKDVVLLYYDMTGTGLGYDTLFDAEAAYFRGELNEAAVLAHKAIYLSTNTAQPLLSANAAKILAQIAKHRIDKDGWVYALRTLNSVIEREDATDLARGCNAFATLTRYELLTILGDYDALPEWLREGSFAAEPGVGTLGFRYRIHDPNIPYVRYPVTLWTHMLYLLLTGQVERMLAADAVAQMYGIPENLLIMRAFCALTRGVCYLGLGDRAAASREFVDAVEITLPDRMWLILGEFSGNTDGIVADMLRARRQQEACAMVEGLSRGLTDMCEMIRHAFMGSEAIKQLTPREHEVAKLAGEGMRNREIASRLNVTEQTIKFHLSNTYEKLAVSGRSELAKLLRDTL